MSLTPSASSLRISVPGIVERSANPEMIRVDASGVIATMTDDHAVGDWPVRPFPGNTIRAILSSCDFDDAIPPAVFARRPKPTVARLVNICPESLDNIEGATLVSTSTTTVLATSIIDAWLTGHELLSANEAGTGDGILGMQHLSLLYRGEDVAMPQGGANTAVAFCCPNYTTGGR